MRGRKRELYITFCSVLFHNLGPLPYINILVCMNYGAHHTVMSCLEYDLFLLTLYVFYSISIASIALLKKNGSLRNNSLLNFVFVLLVRVRSRCSVKLNFRCAHSLVCKDTRSFLLPLPF